MERPRDDKPIIKDQKYDAGLNPTSIAVTADIPAGESVPMIQDPDDPNTFFRKGFRAEFDSSWDGNPVDAQVTMPDDWEVTDSDGTAWSNDGNVYSNTMSADDIKKVVDGDQNREAIRFNFQSISDPNKVVDPAMVIRRPPSV